MSRHGLRRSAGHFVALAWALIVVAGCRPAGSTVLGTAPEGTPTTVTASLEAAPGSQNSGSVTLQGVMIEKCPVAGCWFKLRDATGTLKVDTKFAGFVVLDVPVNTPVVVTGRLVDDGKERCLAATGLRY